MKIREVIRKIRMRKIYYGANRIAYIGENVSLPNNIRVPGGGKNIVIQDNVSFGQGLVFMALNASITIKHNVVASENLKIITGDHERRVGLFCNTITEAIKKHNIGLDNL